jgi:phosphonate transport system substrate-binding protein
MARLKLVSCLAPCLEPVYRDVATHLGVDFCSDAPWEECERRLLHGEVELGFLCGLGYVRQAGSLELLGAPVFRAPRYGGEPVYFSEVVVRADSPWTHLEQLRGARWAYNEPNSQSGYNVMLSRLAEPFFFGQCLESGSHAASLEMVQNGFADVACIDTTVLEELRPTGLRTLEVLGPSPIQPLLVSTRVPLDIRRSLRRRLLQHPGFGPVAGFVEVTDSHYDPIRSSLALLG